MRNPLLQFFAVTIFLVCTSGFLPAIAQQKNPLVNSGELLKQGIAAYDSGSYRRAANLFSQISRSDTNYDRALHELMLTYYSDSMFEQSRLIAEKGLKLFPARASFFYQGIADALDDLERRDEAIAVYNKAIALYPMRVALYLNKAISYKSAKKTDSAKLELQKGLLINPYYSSFHYHLGEIYLKEGQIIPAMLALQTYLIVNPAGRYASKCVEHLNSIARVTDDVINYTKNKKAGSPGFEMAHEIVLSKIALDKKYKLQTQLEDPIMRQLQVVAEKLEYNKKDKNFAMQFYAPFYSTLLNNKKFEAAVYTMFSAFGVAEIDKWNKKHTKDINDFKTYADDYFTLIRSTQLLLPDLRDTVKIKYHYVEGALYAKGNYNPAGKGTFLGPWEFYYDNTTLKSKGVFDNTGEKTGEWIGYYEDGSIKEKINFAAGDMNGIAEGWYLNGNKYYKETRKNGKINGMEIIWYYNGVLKSETNYSMGEKDGSEKIYYSSGELFSQINYVAGKENGEGRNYFANGKIKTIANYSNGIQNGIYKEFSENGKVILEGNVVNDKRDGLWTSYYNDGRVKTKTTYRNGDATGEYTEYSDNGKIYIKGAFYKSKYDGKVQLFSKTEKLLGEYIYERGKLREVIAYDLTGKQIYSTTTRKGAANIQYFSPEGTKTSEGYFNRDGNRDGLFTYYYLSGKKKAIENYVDGKLQGKYASYYTNGNIKYENTYLDDKEDGYAKSYFYNGNLKTEGWVVNGDKQGKFINYNMYGDIISTEYYLNDEVNGYAEYYYPGGIEDYEQKFFNGWLSEITQFDTTGNIIVHTDMKNGNADHTYKHFNGKILSERHYKNYNMDGKYLSYFYNGTPSSLAYYKNGERDSINKLYYFNGKVKSEGIFKSDKKAGLWKYYYDNGKIQEEELHENGQLHGKDQYYNSDGTFSYVINFSKGNFNGAYKIYGENNNLAIQLNYEDGDLKSYTYENNAGVMVSPIMLVNGAGKAVAYYKNGIKSAEIEFSDGEANGMRKIYFTSGKIYRESIVEEGYESGLLKTYFVSGQLWKSENFVHGERHGVSKTFYATGKLKAEENYYNDELHGLSKYYDEQGNLKTTQTWYYGIMLKSY